MSGLVDVRFVATPFLPEHQPALGVSSLVAVLAQRDLRADVRYLNLDYGRAIGWQTYALISRDLAAELLTGEVVFARAMWGERALRLEAFEALLVDRCSLALHRAPRSDADLRRLIAEIRGLQEQAPDWISRWADEVMEGSPRVIGLTTTFAQTNASLALARELRRRHPTDELKILLGGANCEGGMGRCLSERFDFIDHVVSGEAEDVICDLVCASPSGAHRARPRYVVGTPVRAMDALPIPDFSDYFRAVRGTVWERDGNLAAESSRGCWWGQKSHCTFCGLNGESMTFRSKSPERFANELDTLAERYGDRYVTMTDNILDMRYVQTLFPLLARRPSRPRLFYEIKSNLRKDQLELLVAGGVSRLQPGIESLSTPILRLMAKGTSRLQNIQLIKWCMEFRVDVSWLFLFGFPGESAAEYVEMQHLIPSLVHLQAPVDAGQVRLDRFSPYFADPEGSGMRDVRPAAAYEVAFAGVCADDLRRLAYYFDFSYEDGAADPRSYAAPCLDLLAQWRAAWERRERPVLQFTGPDKAAVVDTRLVGEPVTHPITRVELEVLDAIDRMRARARLPDDIEGLTCDELLRILDVFRSRRWIVEDRDQVLSLVVDPGQRWRIRDRQTLLQESFAPSASAV